MELFSNLQIMCPIRGLLKAHKKSKNGLSSTEEYYRVEAIRHLLDKGYPKEHFLIEPVISRFGNSGRNSFRSDFAVLDIPVECLPEKTPDEILKHALVLCEVKRDNAKDSYVKETQVKPMLNFAVNQSTIGLYWNNVERRVFWIEVQDNSKQIKEGPITFLPAFGHLIQAVPLTFNTIKPTESLVQIFTKIESVLHQASYSPEERYEIILQLLLAKIYDEHKYKSRPYDALDIQDYRSLGYSPEITKKKVAEVVDKAVSHYSRHLPKMVSTSLPLSGDTLNDIMECLAPVKITHSKREVIQTFYMKFAKDLYKWDMAQYFTPTTITDFLVDIINPQFGEHIVDPACGSADFLVAAFRTMRKYDETSADNVWGYDNSKNAVQVAVLNMILNGDGKSHIFKRDSLENSDENANTFDVVTCNPPFGTKIVEKREQVLKDFDLGHVWETDNGNFKKTEKLQTSQETGVLFVEMCVKICKPGGRIAIILPNGYLGNRSPKYKLVREWLLKRTKVAAIISLPRFTFKSSGADVSASVLYLEKRLEPIETLQEDIEYKFSVQMIEKVGWEAGNKNAKPIYKRDNEDGSYIMDEDGNLIVDSDFGKVSEDILSSDAAVCFNWLSSGKRTDAKEGWSISIKAIYDDKDLTLDPKRYCRKVVELRNSISKDEHFLLGEVVDFLSEKTTSGGKKTSVKKSEIYNYVEIQNIGAGDFSSNELRGWELPDRAKHFAEPEDIFIGSIWGSVSKWCYIPSGSQNVVVTNGCFRCRMKAGKEEFLPDLLAYLNSEGWSVQMRSMARGSDGLAEICVEDARNIIVPKLKPEVKAEVIALVNRMKGNNSTVNTLVKQLIRNGELDYNDPTKRPSHIVLV